MQLIKVKEIFDKWDLEAAVIGRVTDDGMLSVVRGERNCSRITC